MDLVNDPQIWTLIGVFTTIMLGGMTLMTTFINRATTSGIGAVNTKIDGVAGQLDAKIDGVAGQLDAKIDGVAGQLDAKIDGLRTEMNARFEAMNTRIDHLDRDVSALTRRVWGEPTAD
jgi:hypothetical protein